MAKKRRLYFKNSPDEVWPVTAARDVRFFGPDGRLRRSRRAPDFLTMLPA